MKMRSVVLTVIIPIFLFVEDGNAQPTFTQCQWQDNPGTIINANPDFSWKSGGNQTAYQIIVSSDLDKLKSNKGELWNSGKVASKECIGISYAGKTLRSNTTYYWKVRVWINDVVSEYSEPKSFKMGNHLMAISSAEKITAESWATVIFKIKVGDGGVKIGDGFSILSPTDGNRFKWKVKNLSWSTWQTAKPEEPGFTTVKTTCDGTVVIPEVVGERNILNLRVSGKNLQPGDIITVVYGDKSEGSPGVQVSALARRCFFPLCKLDDSGETWGAHAWEKFKDAPSIEITGRKASKFNVLK